jgi:hypothetical protein
MLDAVADVLITTPANSNEATVWDIENLRQRVNRILYQMQEDVLRETKFYEMPPGEYKPGETFRLGKEIEIE